MGFTHAELHLTNADDLALVRRGHLTKAEVRSVQITALVDCGAYLLVINDHLKNQLGLPVVDKDLVELADGSISEVEVVGPVEMRFENRRFTGDAMVLPNATEALLGVIPMEGMDVMIDPKRQKLVVNPKNPIRPVYPIK